MYVSPSCEREGLYPEQTGQGDPSGDRGRGSGQHGEAAAGARLSWAEENS